ncbi:hypothetical protein [Streptomyces phaeochromogenes]|uniref:hypothetical protein n=1 Tax=Streptomyces phaeochromogenes TaxID=1923 RepID=UPI0027D7A134|nr:hypothetical protein [Streptomyces phaeochromogenes]
MKYKVRETTEAIVGAVTGPATAPRTLLLGRYDTIGHFQYTGRTTALPQTVGRAVAGLLTPCRDRPPVDGLVFGCRVGQPGDAVRTLVRPELVVEVGVDVVRDTAGRWRHPARWHRPRPGLSLPPADVTLFNSPIWH